MIDDTSTPQTQETQDIPPSNCYSCSELLDVALHAEGDNIDSYSDGHTMLSIGIQPGMFALCNKCKALLVFNDELMLVRPTAQDIEVLKETDIGQKLLAISNWEIVQ